MEKGFWWCLHIAKTQCMVIILNRMNMELSTRGQRLELLEETKYDSRTVSQGFEGFSLCESASRFIRRERVL